MLHLQIFCLRAGLCACAGGSDARYIWSDSRYELTLGHRCDAALPDRAPLYAKKRFAVWEMWGTIHSANREVRVTLPATSPHTIHIPLGIVIRRQPGVTRWARHVWRAVAVLPGAADANWKELRSEGDAVEFHAATLPLVLHRADAEAYLQGLSAKMPAIYVIMREGQEDAPLQVILATASPFEAQDYADTGEELVEKVPMPEGLVAWVRDFVELHHEEDTFVKRRRDKSRVDRKEDGIGDARIRQTADVYRAPAARKRASRKEAMN